MCGIGFWKDKEEIASNYKVGKVFETNMSEKSRNVRLERGNKAIKAVIDFQ